IAEREVLSLQQAGGRVIAADLNAGCNAPAFDNSAMDGYAVRASDIEAGKALPVSQRIAAGASAAALAPGTSARIFTGAMLPAGADTVVMQEQAQLVEDGVVFTAEVKRGANVRCAGEDFRQGERLAEQGETLRPASIGRLAAAGCGQLPCYARPRVAFFSSGDELAEPGEALGAGQIYNSNRYALYQQLLGLGAVPEDLGRCPDQFDASCEFLRRAAASADCVISTGGMSVGEEDHVRAAAQAVGAVDFWKIALKPGKPLAFGSIGSAAFFGLPGNPVSAFVTFQLLVRPWLLKRAGANHWQHIALPARADFSMENRGGRLNFLRATLRVDSDGKLCVSRYPEQGSGLVSSLVASNALLPLAAKSSIAQGQIVEVLSLDRDFVIQGGAHWPG
ncbi:MAG: molybdopterin molybdotransferase MoeA, partial [Gammaproteobacteria bacterium]|nr:molybdopterin molybdotransferase MoeA [Gammaproteobacteria bacterium]